MAAVDLADEQLHVVQAVSIRGVVRQLHHDLQRGMLGVVSTEQCRVILREERRHGLLHVAHVLGGAKPLGIRNLLYALRSF